MTTANEGTLRYADSMLNPDDPLIQRINNMFMFVATYNGFKDFTMVSRILMPTYFSEKVKSSLGTPFPNLIQNSVDKLISCTEKNLCGIDMDAFGVFYTADASQLPKWNDAFKSENAPFKTYVDPPSGSGQGIDRDFNFGGASGSTRILVSGDYIEHRRNMLSFFTQAFNYQKSKANIELTGVLENQTRPTDSAWVTQLYTQLVSQSSADASFTKFYTDAVTAYDGIFAKTTASAQQKNLFFLVMYPMFIFEYMCQNVGKTVPTASDKAPRNLVLRRYAVGCVYLFEYYLVRFLEESGLISSGKSNSFVQAVNNCVKNEIYNNLLTEKYEIRKDNRINLETSKEMEAINVDITMARNNLSKAIVSNGSLVNKVRWSLAYMIIWITIFGLVTIALPIMLFLYKQGDGFRGQLLKYMFYVCGVILFILVVSGIVQVAQNM